MHIARASIVTGCLLSFVLASSVTHAQPPVTTEPAPQSSPPAPRPPEPAAKEATAATPAVTPVPAPTPAEIHYRRMSVNVTSTRPDAVLERRVSVKEGSGAFLFFPWRDRQSTWEQVCIAPCRGAELDRYSTYRVAEANGISSSPPFTLPQQDTAVHLELDAGNRYAHHAGVGLASAGLAAIIVGVSLLAVAPTVVNHDNEVRTRDAGFITAGAGLVVFAVGLPLALLTRTCVYADDKPVRAADMKPRFVGNGLVF